MYDGSFDCVCCRRCLVMPILEEIAGKGAGGVCSRRCLIIPVLEERAEQGAGGLGRLIVNNEFVVVVVWYC